MEVCADNDCSQRKRRRRNCVNSSSSFNCFSGFTGFGLNFKFDLQLRRTRSYDGRVNEPSSSSSASSPAAVLKICNCCGLTDEEKSIVPQNYFSTNSSTIHDTDNDNIKTDAECDSPPYSPSLSIPSTSSSAASLSSRKHRRHQRRKIIASEEKPSGGGGGGVGRSHRRRRHRRRCSCCRRNRHRSKNLAIERADLVDDIITGRYKKQPPQLLLPCFSASVSSLQNESEKNYGKEIKDK